MDVTAAVDMQFDARDERYAAKDGFGHYLEHLRDTCEATDFMLRAKPFRAAVRLRGDRYRRINDELVPHYESWFEIGERLYSQPGVYKNIWDEHRTLDVALRLPHGGVGRMHFWHYQGLNLSVRIQPDKPVTLDDVLPIVHSEREEAIRADLIEMFTRRQGLIVIGGEVCSGKTWLEHAMYNYLNTTIPDGHAWLIGDPLEFHHEDDKWLFTQVDVTERGTSQAEEIRQSLRVPRKLLGAGEMRGDTESTEAALIASLAGTLCTATGHFSDVQDIVSRFSLGSAAMSEASKKEIFLEALQGVIHLALVPGISRPDELVVSYTDFGTHSMLKTDLKEGTKTGPSAANKGYRPLAADAAFLLSKNRISAEVAARLGVK